MKIQLFGFSEQFNPRVGKLCVEVDTAMLPFLICAWLPMHRLCSRAFPCACRICWGWREPSSFRAWPLGLAKFSEFIFIL